MKIILGSYSPRRKMLLASLISDFTVIAPHIDERRKIHENPLAYSERISKDKMLAVVNELPIFDYELPYLIITADTIVTIGKSILGKPGDYDEAFHYISLLNGKTHKVITSITLAVIQSTHLNNPTLATGSESTKVTFKALSQSAIELYLNSIEFKDKAGAYAFQENGKTIIDSYRGSVTNIIGFPLRLFFSMLSDMGIMGSIFNN